MKRILSIIVAFLLTFHPILGQDFAETAAVLDPLASYENVEWVDLDGDKDFDAVAATRVEKATIFKNDSGILTNMGDALEGQPLNYDDHHLFVDFDNNGYIDILLSGMGKVDVLLNQGDFTFDLRQTGIDFVSTRTTSLRCVDIDADADMDIVIDGKIFLNTNGTFAESIVGLPENVQNYLWGDLNNDGILDFVNIYYSVIPYIGKRDGIFEKGTEFARVRSDGTFFLTDADGDGDLDMYMSEATYTEALYKNLFKETGVVSFSKAYTFPFRGKISYGDIDRNGLVDLVAYGYYNSANRVVAFMNTSTESMFSFNTIDLQILEEVTSAPFLVDFDGDGDLDLHLGSFNSVSLHGEHKIYWNDQTSPLTPPPQSPANPATIIGEEIALTWQSVDKSYYALEVERDGVTTFPAFSLDDGTIMLPKLQMPLTGTSYYLRNLPAGNYRWRVQAVDQASRASAFTDYQSFTIDSPPSSLTLKSNDFTDVTLSWTYEGTPTGFAVYRRSEIESWTQIGEVPATDTSFRDNTLVINRKYEYSVRAVQGEAYSAPAMVVSYYSGQFREKPFAQANPEIRSDTGGAADIDDDGDYDFQFFGAIGGGNEVTMKNDGTGNFTAEANLPPDSYNDLLSLVDMDADGDIDMCVRRSGSKFAVLKNTDGHFAKWYESGTISIPLGPAIKDFNNDGLLDIFYARSDYFQYELLYQQRDGTFIVEPFPMPADETVFRPFKTVDVNNDGFLDIFFAGSSYPKTKALLATNINGHTFDIKETDIYPHGDNHFQDLNGDGFVDVLYKYPDSRLVIQFGAAGGTFGDPVFLRAFYLNGDVTVLSADLDLNGWPDLVVFDQYNNIGAMKNNGEGELEVAAYRIDGKHGTHIFLTDLENDGDVDILNMANPAYEPLNNLYENLWKSDTRTNKPPSPPSNVTSTVGNGVVRIQWNESLDDTTPTKLISYDVLIVDANGKSWVHPATNAAGTFRKVLGEGNAGTRTFFMVNDLPGGVYTVKVQALDASFALSEWSDPHTFTVEGGPTNLTIERIFLNKVRLRWEPGSSEATGVIVERKTPSTDYEVIAELGAGSTEFVDGDLKYNEQFTYRVHELIDTNPTAHSNTILWNTTMWEITDTPLPNADQSLDVGDVTGDGKMDILLTGHYPDANNNSVRVKAVFENTETGFIRSDFGASNNSTASLGDFNMDGTLDICEYSWSNGAYETLLYPNNGGKISSTTTNGLSSQNLEIISGIDYDMDNDLDYYVAARPASEYPSAKIANNVGSDYQIISDPTKTCEGYDCSFIAGVGDFDRDGDEDAIRAADGAYKLYLNTPRGFELSNVSFNAIGTLSCLDFDGDGWLDVLFLSINGFYVGRPHKLFRNLGSADTIGLQFEQVEVPFPPVTSSGVSSNSADFDNDGDLDLMLVTPGITFLQNNNDNTFERYDIPRFNVFSSGKSNIIDYDEDGDLDIIFTGFMSQKGDFLYSKIAKVVENKLIDGGRGLRNAAPDPPTNLRFHQDASGLHLEWDAPQDDHTPATALTYDVVLYKGDVAVFKNSLVPSTGARPKLIAGRVPGSAVLNNIAPGEYQWKVQAVDQSYAASEFSSLATLTMLPPAPFINDTSLYRCDRMVTLTVEGENIRWYSDEAKTNLLASGTFHPTESQKVFVTQTIDGVEGVAAVMNIEIIERPQKPDVPSGYNIEICEGFGSYVYMRAVGENIEWFSDAALRTKVEEGPNYNAPMVEASYFVTQTVQQCQSLPSEIVVNAIDIDARLVYESGNIRALEEDADYYGWYRDGNFSGSTTSNTIQFDGIPATYSVYILKDGCGKVSEPFVLTGAEENEPIAISVYPNPSMNRTDIVITKGDHLEVLDNLGRLVYSSDMQPGKEFRLAVPDWKQGAYSILIRDGAALYVRKLIIH